VYIKVTYPAKNCEWCKKEFIPNRKDKRFCKKSCQKRVSERRTGKKERHALRRRGLGLVLKWAASKKKDYCECCGFVATHRCQLDLDHIDGDHANNEDSNLQTLCANCHRLKTWMNRDWENKKGVPSDLPDTPS